MGQLQYNAGGFFAGLTLTGDCTLVYTTGVITCTKTNGVAFSPSATTDTTNATNITSGTVGATRLPNPSASTIGGVESITAVTHNFLTSISTSGVPAQAQPACADISNAGTACTVNTGTSGATLALLNAANTWSALQTFSATPSLYLSGGAAETIAYSNGNSGTSLALNIDNGNLQSTTITGAVAITLTTPTHPGKSTIVITEDATGHVYSVSGCKWPGGTAITYSTAANAIDVISMMYDGVHFYCMGGAGFN